MFTMVSHRQYRRINVIDSHTAGEPTRVITAGAPDLGNGDIKTRLQILKQQHDAFRTSVVLEPRGSEVMVGALLCPPYDSAHAAGVIFFNDVGYLGMCGHGMIGVVTTLAHLGSIRPGVHSIETPVGIVSAILHPDGSCSIENVPSYRHLHAVTVTVPSYGSFTGDIAWGGNWFFLADQHNHEPKYELKLANRAALVAVTSAIRKALHQQGITGADGKLIDHIELFSPPHDKINSARNFVLCPGASFDRSPCGTGTSAKMACLYARGQLRPGDQWRQEGILGTVFTGTFSAEQAHIIPSITGRAWITAESSLLFDSSDPFANGIEMTC